MPNPYFEPIIGRDFDSLAGQRMGWANFNRQVEETDIAQANADDRARNLWLANLAQMQNDAQNRDVSLQLQADAQARQQALAARQEATRQKERAEDISIQKEQFGQQLAYGKQRLDEQERIAQAKLDATQKNKDILTDTHGQHLAANYGPASEAVTKAAADVESAQGQIDKLEGLYKSAAAKTAANKKLTPEEQQVFNSYTKTSQQLQAALRQRTALLNQAERKRSALEIQAQNAGFDINDDGTIVHSESGKKWNWKTAMKQASAAMDYRPGSMNPLPPYRPAVRLVPEGPGQPAQIVSGDVGDSHNDIISDNDLGTDEIDSRGFVNPFGAWSTREETNAAIGGGDFEPGRTHSQDPAVLNQAPTKRWIWDRQKNRPVLVQ